MLHLYCIVPAGHNVPDGCEGLQSSRPFTLDVGPLAIWASEHEAPVPPSIEVVRTHNDVVATAMTQQVTPVPLRFGQAAADRETATAHIADDAAKWVGLLERFAGHAEYGVRAIGQVPAAEQDVHAADVESGTEYMAALARKQAQATQRRAHAERIAEIIRSAAGGIATDMRVEPGKVGSVVTVACLVAWTAVEAYHGAIREVCEVTQDTKFVLTGPWPPYSFVE
jgi:hypothetical protein